jgi:hypothetical protein
MPIVALFQELEWPKLTRSLGRFVNLLGTFYNDGEKIAFIVDPPIEKCSATKNSGGMAPQQSAAP